MFVFKPNFGNDSIVNFQPGQDYIEIDHTIFADATPAGAHGSCDADEIGVPARFDRHQVSRALTARRRAISTGAKRKHQIPLASRAPSIGHSGCTQRPDTWLHPNASRPALM
jgi:hypothetical protein